MSCMIWPEKKIWKSFEYWRWLRAKATVSGFSVSKTLNPCSETDTVFQNCRWSNSIQGVFFYFFYFNAYANWNWLYSTNREIACQSILYDKLNRLARGNVPTAISNDKPFWSRLRNETWLLLSPFFSPSLRPKLAKRRRPLCLRVMCPKLRTWRRRWRGSVRNTSTSWLSPTPPWWT